jgi:xanthine/uracil permease
MATETNIPRSDHTLSGLVRELRDETTTLIQQEVALAKTEMAEKASKFSRNAAYLAVGGLVAYAGFMFILLTLMRLITLGLLAAGLSEGVVAWLSPAIIGLIVAGIGYALVQKAINTFSREPLVPEKTIQSLKEDKQWTQDKFRRAA